MRTQTEITIFLACLTLVFVLLDVYVLAAWSRFTKMKKWPALSRTLPWWLAGIMAGLFVYVSVRRMNGEMQGADFLLYVITSVWYLPKLGIAPVLAVWQGSTGFVRLVKKLFVKLNKTQNENETESNKSAANVESRRNFLATSGWSLATIPYATVGIGLIKTVYDYEVRREEITLPNFPRVLDGFTLVQISDVHAGSYSDNVAFEEARRIIEQQKPDAVVITGDFVNFHPDELGVIGTDLERLAQKHNVFASLGNHDHYNSESDHRTLKDAISAMNIRLLVNEHVRLGMGGEHFALAGTDNTGLRQNFADVKQALSGVDPEETVVLMAHDPTFWDAQIVAQQPVDLMLSGHTHGGQIGVNLFGFQWSPAQLVYEQWAGLYRKGEQLLYVNKGLGTVGPPIRIGIQPEITVFTFRAPSFDADKA